MKRTAIIISILLLCTTWCRAQISASSHFNIKDILTSIEQNNTTLKALRHSNEANIAELASENGVGETSVEYSPFYQRGARGVASSELIVSQEFDFPTVYGARRKAVGLRQSVLDNEYQVARRSVMLDALMLCYDLSSAIDNASLLGSRLAAADSLLVICERRMQLGSATIMEQNRVRMDRMTVAAELVKNDGDIARLKMELAGMGADEKLLDNTGEVKGNAADIDGIISATEVGKGVVESAEQEIKLARQQWLPKLTVGYRRNTELREPALNGFMVGVSMPLFSNSQKVRAAQLRKSAAEEEVKDARRQQENRRRALKVEASNLRQLLDTYDTELMTKTLADLMRAVSAGELSIMEYYAEAERVYSALQSRLVAENSYNKALAELQSIPLTLSEKAA